MRWVPASRTPARSTASSSAENHAAQLLTFSDSDARLERSGSPTSTHPDSSRTRSSDDFRITAECTQRSARLAAGAFAALDLANHGEELFAHVRAHQRNGNEQRQNRIRLDDAAPVQNVAVVAAFDALDSVTAIEL